MYLCNVRQGLLLHIPTKPWDSHCLTLIFIQMAKIEKTFNGKRFTYLCNGEVYRQSVKDYKYACVATTRKAKGAISEGHEFILSLGNKVESTYNSMARFYRHCDLEVVEIQ